METGISVACEVSVGTFMSEYFVKIRMIDGNVWTGAVDREMVFGLQDKPTEKDYVKGRIYTYLVSFDKESATIELPIEDSTIGRRIIVSLGLVRKERVPA
jgi:hypothetical protein